LQIQQNLSTLDHFTTNLLTSPVFPTPESPNVAITNLFGLLKPQIHEIWLKFATFACKNFYLLFGSSPRICLNFEILMEQQQIGHFLSLDDVDE
jgi:hypothetical protein